MPWRREMLLTPVFFLGEFHGLYSLWGRKELDARARAFSVLIQVLMQSKYCRHPVLGIPAASTKKFVGSLGCVLNEIGMQAVDSMDELT